MMIKKQIFAKILFSSLLLPVLSHAENINAQPFKKVNISDDTLIILCKNYQLKCAEDTFLWHTKKSPNTYYLIDNKPELLQLRKKAKSYQIINRWDFSDYQHHSQMPHTQDMGESGYSIYPALYPINKNKMSIAVLKSYSTGFSGGVASEAVADFVMLEDNGKYKTAVKDILFSENHMYRACFGAEDYETSLHCHEEGWIVLRIKFIDNGKPFYQWKLKYSDYFWDAHQPKSSTTVSHNFFTVNPFTQQEDIVINDE